MSMYVKIGVEVLIYMYMYNAVWKLKFIIYCIFTVKDMQLNTSRMAFWELHVCKGRLFICIICAMKFWLRIGLVEVAGLPDRYMYIDKQW